MLTELDEAEGQQRQAVAELERRRAILATAERDGRSTLAQLAARRQAELLEIASFERRREAIAATTAELEARQQSMTQALRDRERDVPAAPAPASGDDSASDFSEAREMEVSARADIDGSAAEAGEPGQRVFLHYSELEPGAEALADRVARDLVDRGVAVADIRAVGFGIGGNRVRYFFGDEAAAAPAIGESVAGSLGSGSEASLEVQDFTHFEPKPSIGTIEVWVTAAGD